MKIHIGFDLALECYQQTPLVLMLNVHPSRTGDLIVPDWLVCSNAATVSHYTDVFGNRCARTIAYPGRFSVTADAVIEDSGAADEWPEGAREVPVGDMPPECLQFLLGSRYCETDRLSETAWSLFGGTKPGWSRVHAILEYVHHHIEFGYHHASSTRSALDVYGERQGVCRDFAHLAIALCRCMNIPARYATGYLGDIGVPADPAPMDFSAWFEVYLEGGWYALDARHYKPRIGRILMARGRDASDVALTTSFGMTTLTTFQVWTDEIAAQAPASLAA